MSKLQGRFIGANTVSTDSIIDGTVTSEDLSPSLLSEISGGITADISQEVLDRQAADSALDSRLTTVESDVSGLLAQNLDSRLTTVESDVVTAQTTASDAQNRVQTLESYNLNNRLTAYDNFNTMGRIGLVENTTNSMYNSLSKPLGIATLDGAGKVPVAQLPSAIMEYQGTYNATTNIPPLVDGAINSADSIGSVYRVAVAGTQNFGSGSISFDVGDYVILNVNKVWEKSDTTDSVVSVNSKQGVVSLDLPDFPLVQSGISSAIPAGVVFPYAGSSVPSGFLLCDGSEVSKTTYPNLYAAIGDIYATQYNELTGANWASPGTGNFRIPDYRGSFLRGVGTPSGLDAVSLGGRQAQKTAKNGLSNASSTVTGSTDIGHSHTLGTTNVSLNVGAGTDAAGAHTHPVNNAAPMGHAQNGVAGGDPHFMFDATNGGSASTISAGSHSHNVSGSTNIGHTHTLGSTNVSLTSGSAAAQTITGDNETRPMNKGVNFIIRAN